MRTRNALEVRKTPPGRNSPFGTGAKPAPDGKAEPNAKPAGSAAGATAPIVTRKAMLREAPKIHDLIAYYSPTGLLLPRGLAEICENVRDFVVAVEGATIIGCGALHLYGTHLAEVRSIAVDPAAQRKGAGRLLVEALLHEAEFHNVTGVCLFTRSPEFFARLGFVVAKKEDLPDKIYKDCLHCPRLHACDEVAMLRGELPKLAILEPGVERSQLLQIRA